MAGEDDGREHRAAGDHGGRQPEAPCPQVGICEPEFGAAPAPEQQSAGGEQQHQERPDHRAESEPGHEHPKNNQHPEADRRGQLRCDAAVAEGGDQRSKAEENRDRENREDECRQEEGHARKRERTVGQAASALL